MEKRALVPLLAFKLTTTTTTGEQGHIGWNPFGKDHNNDNISTKEDDTDQLERLLQEKMAILRSQKSRNTRNGQSVSIIVDEMLNLYYTWWQSSLGGKKPRNSQIFDIMMQVCTHYDARAPHVLAILEHYVQTFGSHLEFKPHRFHYDMLLLAHVQDPQRTSTTTTTSTFRIAKEVIQLLEYWSFLMKPVLPTYLLATSCVALEILRRPDLDPEMPPFLQEMLVQAFALFQQPPTPNNNNNNHHQNEPLLQDDTTSIMLQSLSHAIRAQVKLHLEFGYPISLETLDQSLDIWTRLILDHPEYRVPFLDDWLEHMTNILPPCLDSDDTVADFSTATVAAHLVNTVVFLWSKTTRPDALERAEFIFTKARTVLADKILDHHQADHAMLDLYARAGLAEKAQALLESETNPPPNHVMTVLLAWVNSGHVVDAPQRALDLLRRWCMEPSNREKSGLESTMFHPILYAWTKSERPDAAFRFLCGLNQLGLPTDHVSYGIVISAFVKEGNPLAIEKVIEEKYRIYRDKKTEDLRPNINMFAALMEAWIKSGDPDVETKVRQVAERIIQLHKDGILLDEPPLRVWNLLLLAIVSSHSTNCAQRADQLLDVMKTRQSKVRPDAVSYSYVITAHLKSKGGLARAEQLLAEAFSNREIEMGLPTVGMVISSLAMAGEAPLADAWFHRVLDKCAAKRGRGCESPSPSLLGAVISSWIRMSTQDPATAAQRVENLIGRMLDLKERGWVREGPDFRALRAWPALWAQTGGEKGANRAWQALHYLQQDSTLPNPDASVYNEVIRAYAENDNCQQAEMIFRQMLNDYLGKGITSAEPDLNCFNHVLKAFYHFGRKNPPLAKENYEKAEALLREIQSLIQEQKLNLRLNRNSYHLVMSLCPPDDGPRMKQYLEQMKHGYCCGRREDGKPTKRSYEFVIKAFCRRQGGQEAAWQAEILLREACQEYKLGNWPKPPDALWFDRVVQTLEAAAVSAAAAGESRNIPDIVRSLRKLQEDVSGELNNHPNRPDQNKKHT